MAITDPPVPLGTVTDHELVGRALDGDPTAFAELYERHAPIAHRVAYIAARNPEDAADAVAEAFTKVFARIAEGTLLPDTDIRAYLVTSARNAVMDTHRRHKRTDVATDDTLFERSAGTAMTPDELSADKADGAMVAQAFADLPERWRSVLWLTEVEGMEPKEAANHLGVSPNNVAQLATRARRRLRARYLQAHLVHGVVDPACKPVVPLLGAFVAATLAPRDVAKVDQHLAGCDECRDRVEDLEAVGGMLRRIVLPLPLLAAASQSDLFDRIGIVVGGTAAAGAGVAAASSTGAASGSAGSAGTWWSNLPSWAQGGVAAMAAAGLVAGGMAVRSADNPGTVPDTEQLRAQREAVSASSVGDLENPSSVSNGGGFPSGSLTTTGQVSAPFADSDGSTDADIPPQDEPIGTPDGDGEQVDIDNPDAEPEPEPTTQPTVQTTVGGRYGTNAGSVSVGLGDGNKTGATAGSTSVGESSSAPDDDGLTVEAGGSAAGDGVSLTLP